MQNCSTVDETLCRQLGIESPCFVGQLLPQLMDLVRASRRLPLGEEHAIRRGSRDFLHASKELGEKSLATAHRTLCFLDPATHKGTGSEELCNFNVVIDSIDSVLERADACLREALAGASTLGGEAASGSMDAPEEQEELGRSSSALSRVSSFGGPSGRIAKPQVRWRQLIDNARTEFVPRVAVKHNQKVPLQPRLLEAQMKRGLRPKAAIAAEPAAQAGDANVPSGLLAHLDALGVGSSCAAAASVLPHPYEEELRTLAWPEEIRRPCEPQRHLRLEDTPLVWVRTRAELEQLVAELKSTCIGSEIAVDVEHHDFRSYRGFTCLVQLSTRRKDFLIDPFDIFEDMHMLNEVMTDPRIVKVLHGADRDVMWLQRDFSVYIVNMFDTGQAARSLKLQGGFSLANLVQLHCGIKLDKKYQTADWRERPLGVEMAMYARMDTHYLLYCYDCVRNSLLLQQSVGGAVAIAPGASKLKPTVEGLQALNGVLEKSAALCRTLYTEAPFVAADDAMRLRERFGAKQRPLEAKQFSALQALVAWRDQLARSLDESWNFVSPDACLWRVALALPPSASRLRSTCNPLPPMMQDRAQEIVDIVARCEEACTAVAGHAAFAAVATPAMAAAPAPAPALTAGPLAVAATPELPPAAVRTPAVATKEWPVRSTSSLRPLVTVSTERMANGAVPTATLASMFEFDESSNEEEDVSMEAPKPMSHKEKASTAIGGSFALAAVVPLVAATATPASAASAAAPAAAVEAAKGEETTPVALRDVYSLQQLGRKKRKAQQSAGEAGKAAGALGLRSMEAEALLLRSALSGSTVGSAAAAVKATAPSPADGAAVPRKKKRKVALKEDPNPLEERHAAGAPGALVTPVVASPASALAAAAAVAAHAPTPAGAADFLPPAPKPKKKLKKKKVAAFAAAIGEAALEATVAVEDPYAVAVDDPYA